MDWSFKNAVRFAFSDTLYRKNQDNTLFYSPFIEKWTSRILQPIYWALIFVAKHIKKPLAIVGFTLLACLLSVVFFYSFPALTLIWDLLTYDGLRFVLFIYVETAVFCLGLRAYYRFSSASLIRLWQETKKTI